MTAKLYLTAYDSDEDGLPTSAAELTSKSLGTVDALIALDYTHALHGAGQITIKIPRNHTQAALLVQDRYVAVHSDAGVIGGAFLEKAEVQLTSEDEEGGEIVTWTGRGQLAYTERGNLPDITRQEGGEDPDQGTWEWWKQGLSIGATADSLGAMYRRAVLETHDDVPSGIPVLTHDFDFDDDSAGTGWDTSGPVIDSSIGDNLLQVTADFDRFGLFVQMEPTFLLHAYRSYGRDLTGAAFGTGVVRFAAGSNIAAAIGRQLQESVKVTHLRVEGQEFKYKTVVDPDYSDGDPVRWGFLSAPETNDLDTMETLGLANIAARKRQADVFSFPLPDHGNDAAHGIYEPGWPGTSGTHFWVGDSITMHTGSGTYDVDDLTYPISAITWHLLTDDAATGDYQVIVEIGDSYYWSEGSEPGVNAGQHGGCQCGPTLRLCLSTDLLRGLTNASLKASGEQTTPAPAPKSNACDGDDSTPWGSADGEPSIGVAGEWWAADLGGDKALGAYRIRQQGGGTPSVQNVATAVHVLVTSSADVWAALPASGKLGADPDGWTLAATYTGSLAFSDTDRVLFGPADGRYVLFRAAAGGSLDWDVETFELWSHVGAGKEASRCGHTHPHGDRTSSTAPEHSAESIAYDNASSGLSGDTVQEAIDELADGGGAGASGALLRHLETQHRFRIVAHRGDINSTDGYPENTLEGIRQAAIRGADGSEIDVARSSEGTWWLMHDQSVARTTNGTGNIDAKTDAQIAALSIDGGVGYDAGRHGTTLDVPTLASVLDATAPYEFTLILHLNALYGVDAEHTALAEYVAEQGVEDRVIILATSLTGAALIKGVSSRIKVMTLSPVSSSPQTEDDVDIWLAVHSELSSLSDVTTRAPDQVWSFSNVSEIPADESTWMQEAWDYGAVAWLTHDLEAALGKRLELWGISSTPGATAFADLDDVTVTDPVAGEMPRWNGSAWVNDSGLICVDPGSISVDNATPFGITLTSVWGIDGSTPYYDDANAAAGEEAALFYDPLTDNYVLIAYDFSEA